MTTRVSSIITKGAINGRYLSSSSILLIWEYLYCLSVINPSISETTIIPNAEEFDLISNEYFYSEIFVNPALLSHGKIEKLNYFFYRDELFTDRDIYDLNLYLNDLFHIPFSMNRQDLDDYYNPLDQLLFNFLPIENVILILFACVGFILFSTFNNKSSSFEVGLLRAKGFSKKDLIRISFYESVILSLLGLLFCMLLFVAQPVMLMFLNRIRTGGFDQDFYLILKQLNLESKKGFFIIKFLFQFTDILVTNSIFY